jgi:hypothetical protein
MWNMGCVHATCCTRLFFFNNLPKPLFFSCRTGTDSYNDSTFAQRNTKAVNAAVKLVFYIYQLVNYLPLYPDAVSVVAVDVAGQVIEVSHQQPTWLPSPHPILCFDMYMSHVTGQLPYIWPHSLQRYAPAKHLFFSFYPRLSKFLNEIFYRVLSW